MGDLFDILTLIQLTNKILSKKPKFKKVTPNPVPLPKSPNNNFSNLGDAIKSKENRNNIKYC